MANYRKEKPFAKRSFGQNFLVDPTVVESIISGLDLLPGETVIEIGPGRGALTGRLLSAGASVIAIEIDRDMHAVLRSEFDGNESFSLVADDVLQVDLTEILNANGRVPPAKLVGNLPYNISTAILERVIVSRAAFSKVVFMFQREVVDRITAVPGDSERGFYTVLIEAAFNVTRLFDVAPSAFVPRPKVWSSVVLLTPKPASAADDPRFRRLISMAFAQKRKTLRNNLRPVLSDAEAVFGAAGIDAGRRAETLSLDEWFSLYSVMEKTE